VEAINHQPLFVGIAMNHWQSQADFGSNHLVRSIAMYLITVIVTELHEGGSITFFTGRKLLNLAPRDLQKFKHAKGKISE
jgi:hypothetical protein